jgi:uncharacterized membrane protein YdjX (TVP38/TMEM64 family)
LYLLIIFAAAGAFAVLWRLNLQHVCTDALEKIVEIQAAVREWGAAAAFFYIVAYIVLMMLLWVPAWPCSVLGGILFGALYGPLYALAGATLGATAVFLMARSGVGGLTRRAGPFVQRMEAGFHKDALYYLISLRLIPVIPFVAVNIGAAILNLRARTFVAGTFIGIIPSTIIFTQIGGGLAEAAEKEHQQCASLWSHPRLLLALFGLGLLVLLPVALKYLRRNNSK